MSIITRQSPPAAKMQLAEQILAANGSFRLTLLDAQGNWVIRPVGRTTLHYLRKALRMHRDALIGIVPTARVAILSMPHDYAAAFIAQWQLGKSYIVESATETVVFVKNPKADLPAPQLYNSRMGKPRRSRYMDARSTRSVTVMPAILAPGQIDDGGHRYDHVSGNLSDLKVCRKVCWIYRKPKPRRKFAKVVKETTTTTTTTTKVTKSGPMPAREAKPVSMTARQRREMIVRLVDRAGMAGTRLGTRSLAGLAGVDHTTIAKDIASLVDCGAIERVSRYVWNAEDPGANRIAVYRRAAPMNTVGGCGAGISVAGIPGVIAPQRANVRRIGREQNRPPKQLLGLA